MAKGTKICKVCGKEYEYCHTLRSSDIFRWQDVACSPEHAAIYFARVAAARGESEQTASKEHEEVKTVSRVDADDPVGVADKKKAKRSVASKKKSDAFGLFSDPTPEGK